MDEQLEAMKRKRAKAPGITILVDDPDAVEVLPRDAAGKIGAPDAEMESLANPEMAAAAEAEEGESSEDDLRERPDQAPGVYDKGKEAAEQAEEALEGDDQAAAIFDEGETMRRKADGQTKPKGLTDRAAFAAFKGRKK